ncbi:MAG: hypothetical protein M3443_07700 [Actinomycetota bacterium]|nr:hypothetical protein [Actinomycetota bacterium]
MPPGQAACPDPVGRPPRVAVVRVEDCHQRLDRTIPKNSVDMVGQPVARRTAAQREGHRGEGRSPLVQAARTRGPSPLSDLRHPLGGTKGKQGRDHRTVHLREHHDRGLASVAVPMARRPRQFEHRPIDGEPTLEQGEIAVGNRPAGHDNGRTAAQSGEQ